MKLAFLRDSKSAIFTIASALAVLVWGCSTARVSVDRDPTIPIPPGSTWAWGSQGSHELTGESRPEVANSLVRDRIDRAVEAELAAKGLRKAEPEAADFLVHYHIGIEPRRELVQDVRTAPGYRRPFIRCHSLGCWQAWRWGYWGPPEVWTREVRYTEGTLLLDVTQRSTDKLAWRGVATEEMTRNDVREEHIAKDVQRILKDLKPAR